MAMRGRLSILLVHGVTALLLAGCTTAPDDDTGSDDDTAGDDDTEGDDDAGDDDVGDDDTAGDDDGGDDDGGDDDGGDDDTTNDFNMGSDANQFEYGWFMANTTTIDLNASAAAPFDGTMVQWRLFNAFNAGTATMKVFRDIGDDYTLVAEDTQNISPGSALNTFQVNIPVQAGDLLGLFTSDGDVVMCSTGGTMAEHDGNAGTSPHDAWIVDSFTMAADALVVP